MSTFSKKNANDFFANGAGSMFEIIFRNEYPLGYILGSEMLSNIYK